MGNFGFNEFVHFCGLARSNTELFPGRFEAISRLRHLISKKFMKIGLWDMEFDNSLEIDQIPSIDNDAVNPVVQHPVRIEYAIMGYCLNGDFNY